MYKCEKCNREFKNPGSRGVHQKYCNGIGTKLDFKKEKQKENPYKWDLAKRTNPDNRQGGIPEALKGADICISLSKSGPDTIKPEWLK